VGSAFAEIDARKTAETRSDFLGFTRGKPLTMRIMQPRWALERLMNETQWQNGRHRRQVVTHRGGTTPTGVVLFTLEG
jgi:hypothetical protein